MAVSIDMLASGRVLVERKDKEKPTSITLDKEAWIR
jgi:hypothetical protein